MTPLSWALVALALLVGAAPRRAPVRVATLAGRARLSGAPPATVRRHAHLARRVDGRLLAALGVVAVAVVTGGVAGPVLAPAATPLPAQAARQLAGHVARRRHRAEHAAVLAAVRILTAELAAGSLPASALAAAASAAPQVREAFQRAADQAGRGERPEALSPDPRPGIRAVGVAWTLGQDTGSALAGVLERVAEDLSSADAQRRAVAVALAGPRSSAVLVALLPVLGLGLGSAMGASPVSVLGGSPGGRVLCLVGVALDVAGVLWIRSVLRRAERA
ncbi:type II secretion system F family protein [uncultured Jatrophihabitans sp.]|uniref:type II secretion system F family protein n=1 Tax=uncultured Jatrophihabitans sp. TaxID=1610747 RepID=UPI0035CBEF87